MNLSPLLIAILVVLPAAGLAIWASFAMNEIEEEWHSLITVERPRLDISRHAA